MNNDKNLTGIIVGAVIVITIVGGIFWYQNQKALQNRDNNGGSLYIGITDATADINNVSEVNMEVRKIEVHSATSGWTTVSSDSKSYNLLTLKAEGKTELYAKKKVVAGTYDRVRVTLGDTVVKTKTVGDIKAYSPSNQVVMNMTVNVKSEGNTHLKIDFLADKSLHTTSDGKYVFSPVVKAESHSGAEVLVDSDSNAIESAGGSVDSQVEVGVDIDGTTRSNFILTTSSDLKVDSSAIGSVKFILGGKTYTESDVVQEESVSGSATTNTNSNVNTGATSTINVGGALKVGY